MGTFAYILLVIAFATGSWFGHFRYYFMPRGPKNAYFKE